MAALAEFVFPPTAFPLGTVFEEFPDATIELERVVPTGTAVRPYFWVENGTGTDVLTFLKADPAIAQPKLVDRLDSRSLFRYHRPLTEDGLLSALVETDLTLLSAVGTHSGWTVQVRGNEQRSLAAFDQRCRSLGIRPTLNDVRTKTVPGADRHGSVTDPQREALLLAYDRGYYAEPRATSLEELAAELGISRQAFAQRLVRGYRRLIESHLRLPEDEHVS